MMPKILFVANIYEHIYSFHIPYLKWLKEHEYEVHVVANELGDYKIPYADRVIEMGIERSPFKLGNIKALKQLRNLIDKERYDIISCHTPMGGVLARLAARKARKQYGLKVIYTSHGFHFYKGASKKYWMLYYPVEKYLSRFTDAIVTINTEDYELVKTLGFKNEETYLIHGIGIDYTRLRIDNLSINDLRYKYRYKSDDFIMLYLAEFIPRKNHSFLINAMPKLIERIPNIKLILAGRGDDKEKMMLLAKRLGVEAYVDFIGFREDVGNLIYISDIGVSSSSQEGLGMCLAESLFMWKPVVASDIRGHRDLVKSGNNGFLFSLDNEEQFIEQVVYMCNHPDERRTMGEFAAANIGDYVIDNTLNEMVDIYSKVL
jgi:glycosyltransferase EpsD